jgi:hypothetical protein
MPFSFNTIFTLLVFFTFLTGCDASTSNSTVRDSPTIDLNDYSLPALSDEQKYSLAHMWFEEKLAYDLYLELNDLNPAGQLFNIATNSEINHIKLVEELVVAYDLNVTNYLNDYMIHYSTEELSALPRGVFTIAEIQTIYDALFERGKVSKEASLEVGCMVEVVDVDDLNHYIEEAEGNTALVDTFTKLREGSYNHYWTFDNGLKELGISTGCCAFDDQKYCKTTAEFPKKQ